MRPAGYMVLTALLLVGMCSTLQGNQDRQWENGYIPQGEVIEESS